MDWKKFMSKSELSSCALNSSNLSLKFCKYTINGLYTFLLIISRKFYNLILAKFHLKINVSRPKFPIKQACWRCEVVFAIFQTACFLLTFSAFTRSCSFYSRIGFFSFSCEMKFLESVDYWKGWRHREIPKPLVFIEKVKKIFLFLFWFPRAENLHYPLHFDSLQNILT
jgi:hypothetical protein